MSRVGRGLISSDDSTGAVTLPSAPDILPQIQGGTGQDTSSTTGIPELRSGTWYFPQNHVNVKTYGAVGDGITDDTLAIQSALDAVPTGGAVFVPPGDYIITDTLNLIQKRNIRFYGITPEATYYRTRLIWNGVAGGTFLLMDMTRDSLVECLSFKNGTTVPGIGIDLDNSAGAGGVLSTNCHFRNLFVGPADTGIYINRTAVQNGDLHTFEDVEVYGYDGAANRAYGYRIGNAGGVNTSLHHRIVRGSILYWEYGIYVGSGNFNSSDTNFSMNTVDIYLHDHNNSITILNPQSENAERFLQTAATDYCTPFNIFGGRIAPNTVHADGKYIDYNMAGPLTMIGVTFGAPGSQYPAVTISASGVTVPATVTAIGCHLPNASPWAGTLKSVNQFSNTYYNYTSKQLQVPPDIETGWYPSGYLSGLTLSNGTDATNDIDIAVGECSSDDAAEADRVLIANAAVLTKRLDAAWSVGSNAGGLDTGSIANTTYHVFLIKRVDTGVVDALFSTSSTAPTLPTNYTKQRRIGSIIRSGGTILTFVQNNNDFSLAIPVVDLNAQNPGTAAVTRTLTVPLGISVLAKLFVQVGGYSGDYMRAWISDLAIPDGAAAGAAQTLIQPTQAAASYAAGTFFVRTNTSGQVRSRLSHSDAGALLYIGTQGWIDERTS